MTGMQPAPAPEHRAELTALYQHCINVIDVDTMLIQSRELSRQIGGEAKMRCSVSIADSSLELHSEFYRADSVKTCQK